jgi:lysophospholipase L1-like esterase
MDQLVTTAGISANGFTVTSTYVTGGAFSLDGVHPSPRGYALIANKFLEAINAKYGSNFKNVDLGKYRILFPPNPANF